MRDIHFPLNQTQRVRLEAALHELQTLAPAAAPAASVTVADNIPVNQEDNILKGHGTADHDGEVVATLCSVVERVNKLVYVRTLRARYKPEIGDIIVGRVIELGKVLWAKKILNDKAQPAPNGAVLSSFEQHLWGEILELVGSVKQACLPQAYQPMQYTS